MKPLEGWKILSLAFNLPGPVLCWKLTQLGASISKIEPPSGDPLELHFKKYYDFLTEGQTIVTLDLKDAKNATRLGQLLNEADLLVTASRPSSLKRLGLDWETLHTSYPKLSHLAIFGYTAPDQADRPGHDLTYQAEAGFVTPPHLPRTCLADLAGAQEACIQTLALMLRSQKMGESHRVDVSLAESLQLFSQPLCFGLTGEENNLGGRLPRYNLYQTREGWIALAAIEEHFWKKLQTELALKEPSYKDLETKFKESTAKEWEEWGNQNDIPITMVKGG